MIFARVLLTYVFDILCTGSLCSLSVVGMAIFHVLNLFLQSHGHKWTVYRTGRIGVLCIWYVRLDFQFQYNGNAIILMFDHAECRIDKWHITMASHTRPGISTHWQLYCLLNSLLRQTWKKNIKPSFCEGNPPAVESPHTGPPKFNSSDPLQRESTGDQWFRRTQGQ